MATMYDGEYGPDVHIGWANRFIVVAYCARLMVTAAHVARLGSQKPALLEPARA